MKIIFFGTGSFAVPTLRAVASEVVLVVSQPDRPSGRKMQLRASEIKQVAIELGLPVATPEKARAPEFVDTVRALEADALLVASYGQILSQSLLDATRRGGINLHGSLLPRYRGAAPIQRCLLNGDHETGITLMQMDKGMDTGEMIAVSRTDIGMDETYGDLQARLAEIAAEMAQSWMPRICAGDYSANPQDGALATMASKVEKAEAELRWESDAKAEYNRFRAFTPSPGTFLKTNLGVLKILKARRLDSSGHPGDLLECGEGCHVAFSGGSLDLIEVQPENKRPMSARDFMNGFRLRPGASLR